MSELPPSNEPGKETALKSVDLGGLAVSLDEYNKQFHFGTLLGKAIVGSFEGQSPSGASVEEDKEFSFADLMDKHRKEMELTGLALEPIKGAGTMLFAGEEIESSEMRVNLRDGARFVGYLSLLDGETLTEGQITGLNRVARSLLNQLVGQYNLSDPRDARMLELFGNLDAIIRNLERLDNDGKKGLRESATKLSELLSIARQRYLREFLAARNLLAPIGGQNFGPSRWHTDASSESYQKMWDDALKTVFSIGKNPNAKEFQHKVVDHMIGCISYAEDDIKSDHSETSREYWEANRNSFLETLFDARRDLEGLK